MGHLVDSTDTKPLKRDGSPLKPTFPSGLGFDSTLSGEVWAPMTQFRLGMSLLWRTEGRLAEGPAAESEGDASIGTLIKSAGGGEATLAGPVTMFKGDEQLPRMLWLWIGGEAAGGLVNTNIFPANVGD